MNIDTKYGLNSQDEDQNQQSVVDDINFEEKFLEQNRREKQKNKNKKIIFKLIAISIFIVTIIVTIIIIFRRNSNHNQNTEINKPKIIKDEIENQEVKEKEKNDTIEYGQKGYKIMKQCQIKKYFVQGIEVLDENQSQLIISSGLNGQSFLTLIQYDLQTCTFNEISNVNIDQNYFAEGATRTKDGIIYQLTWQQNDILEWNIQKQETLVIKEKNSVINALGMQSGWGLSHRDDNNYLYATDGSNIIYEIDRIQWKTVRRIEVSDEKDNKIRDLNELEIIQAYPNYIFANQFLSNTIQMISLNNGKVVKTWDMNELKNIVIEDIQNNERYFDAVLNGIAYIKDRDSFLISGKLWGTIFEIKFDYKKYIQQ